jgi:hypothetical protein
VCGCVLQTVTWQAELSHEAELNWTSPTDHRTSLISRFAYSGIWLHVSEGLKFVYSVEKNRRLAKLNSHISLRQAVITRNNFIDSILLLRWTCVKPVSLQYSSSILLFIHICTFRICTYIHICVYIYIYIYICGARGDAVVEALHYKPEGRGIDSRWFH